MVEFSLNNKRKTDDGYVIREGLIFEAGDYPDKKFHLTPEELIAAATDFKPVSINLEHIKTPFDGKLGFLHSVKASDDGYSLFGEVRLRECVDEVIGDDPIKVSCEWNRGEKVLEGLALTTKPRVKDAVLMSAYAQIMQEEGLDKELAIGKSLEIFSEDMKVNTDKTWAGWDVMQRVHDMCAGAGAICTKIENESESADFISQKEADAVQKMHDAAIQAGAKCNFVPADFSTTEKKKEMTLVDKILAKFNKAVEEVQQEEGAETKSVADLEAELNAKLDAKFSELESAQNEARLNLENEISALKTVIAEKDKEIADKDEKLAGFSADIDDAEKAKLTASAEAKVEELISAGKVVPAKRDILVSLFSTLLESDLKNTVNFNVDGKEVNRVEAFSSLFEGVVSLKEEVPASATALNSDQGAKEEDNAHIERAKAFAKKIYKNRG